MYARCGAPIVYSHTGMTWDLCVPSLEHDITAPESQLPLGYIQAGTGSWITY